LTAPIEWTSSIALAASTRLDEPAAADRSVTKQVEVIVTALIRLHP